MFIYILLAGYLLISVVMVVMLALLKFKVTEEETLIKLEKTERSY